MANKTITDLDAVTSAVATDEIPIWRAAEGDTRKIEKLDFIGATITGEGAIATGGFTLTVADNATISGSYEANADVTDAVNVGSSIHGASAKTTPVDADTMPLIDSAASNVLKKVTWANIKATIKTYYDSLATTLTNKTLDSTNISTLTAKNPPIDADSAVIVDSAASNVFKRVTYTNIKAFLKTYFDTLYDLTGTAITALATKTTPVDADHVVITDSAASNVPKRVTGTNLKVYLKAYFDTLYGLLATANTWTANNTFNGFLIFGSSVLTIASGVVTATASFHIVDTEGGAASDDLVTINGGGTGRILIIQIASSSRTVTVKDGTGNISLSSDRLLSHVDDTLILFFNGARWCELSYANNF